MASYSSSRPFSEQFSSPAATSSSNTARHSYLPRRPRTAVTSHYRPFSTLYLETPPEPSPPVSKSRSRCRSLIRPVSSSGLASLASMGLFKDKGKEKEAKEKKEQARCRKSSELKALRPAIPLRSLSNPTNGLPQRPSTAHGTVQGHTSARLQKKRSLSSMLSSETVVPIESLKTPLTSFVPLSTPSDDGTIIIRSADTSSLNETERGFGADEEDPSVDKYIKKALWLKRSNMKIHPYASEAPYMQAYDPILLENDRYTEILLRRLNSNGSPTFYDYGKKAPATVLDLGCGPGHWVLDTARTWKDSTITGFDLVDITLPDLATTENIRFVRGNFVKYALPFTSHSFELVRMANLSLCIPYSRWDFVLSEAYRVLAVGGRLELIDDLMFFPYGPTPRPALIRERSTRKPKPPFDHGEEEDVDDVDEDLMEDVETHGVADSSFVSDGETSSSSSCEDKSTDADTLKPDLDAPELSLLTSSLTELPRASETPTSAQTITPAAISVSSPTSLPPSLPASPRKLTATSTVRVSAWERSAYISQNLEVAYERMLENIDIHSRPSDFLPEALKLQFGEGNSGQSSSFQVKLAPASSAGKNDHLDASLAGNYDLLAQSISSTGGSKKPWMNIEWDKGEKKKEKEKKDRPEVFKEDKKEKREQSKEEKKLRKEEKKERKEREKEKEKERVRVKKERKEMAKEKKGMEKEKKVEKMSKGEDGMKESMISITGEVLSDSGALTPPPVLSAKAADRLGISYTVLAAATALSTRRSPSTAVAPAAQSPGIIVWPSTYIPLSPAELEMHACKHIHLLLGCKPALSEWIETFREADGTRICSDEDLCDALWEYECFRRARFNWPSEMPDSNPEEDTLGDPWIIPTPQSTTLRPANSSSGKFFGTSSRTSTDFSLPDFFYTHDGIMHVRTIRVYHATKTTASESLHATTLVPQPL
ncbi:hypothetical protein BDQ12DRAFT_677335 [Crucibulum laeve]|uniref:Methyltransferase domain-containing protein n=1 Tax=Crucibulum laeve TaxID=68775 RepID=A0A5C3M9G3_9AGAR|nr:hypothetical protein BDQ12DRAFT_677335 [Crucibulum laeve]